MKILEQLKVWLEERKSNYVVHHSWLGDTEGGFYSTDEFDFKKLCEEIDNFGEELRAKVANEATDQVNKT